MEQSSQDSTQAPVLPRTCKPRNNQSLMTCVLQTKFLFKPTHVIVILLHEVTSAGN
jgi:hypothetical protein